MNKIFIKYLCPGCDGWGVDPYLEPCTICNGMKVLWADISERKEVDNAEIYCRDSG